MSHPLLSIVVPVYNVEKYIECCLISCLNQNVPSETYEIILVDDGTPDESIKRVLHLINTNSNIKVVAQHNKGLSAARNMGLSVAVGQYVWFIDSDDWIEYNILNIVFQQLNKDVDILTFCASNVINGTAYRRFSYGSMVNLNLKGVDLLSSPVFQHCVPFSIYRRVFLEKNALRFFENIFHEDTEFSPRAYYYAQKVICLNNVLYYVRQNPTSITRTFNFKKKTDLIIVACNLHDFTSDIEHEHHKPFNDIISLALNSSLENYFLLNSQQKKILNEYISKKRFLYRNMLCSTKLKYRLEGMLYFVSSRLFILAHSFFFRYFYKI